MSGSMTMTLNGRLGSTPTLRAGASGTKWVRFRLACNNSYRDQNGKWVETDTTWFTCKAWGKFAMNIARSLHKGDPVIAHGKLVAESYEYINKDSGQATTRNDLGLHLTHIGLDLVSATSVNVKYASGEAGNSKDDAGDMQSTEVNSLNAVDCVETETASEGADADEDLEISQASEALTGEAACAIPF